MPTTATSFLVASGAAAGAQPLVKLYEGNTGALVRDIMAYDPSFRGGVNVALADLNADGIPDLVTGPGVGGGPHVRAFDGLTGAVILNFFAYDPAFRGGVSVAAGTLDGRSVIVTGAGHGGGPHVKVFDTAGGERLGFMAYDLQFRGGVSVAIGDVRGGIGAGPSSRRRVPTAARTSRSMIHRRVNSSANGWPIRRTSGAACMSRWPT